MKHGSDEVESQAPRLDPDYKTWRSDERNISKRRKERK